jgi:hypothetical protein
MHYIRLLLRHHPTNDFVEHNPIHSNPNFGRNLLRGEHSRLHLLALVEILAFFTTDPKEFDNNQRSLTIIESQPSAISFALRALGANSLFLNRSTPTFPNDCIVALSLGLSRYDHGRSIVVLDSHFHESCR